MNKEPPVRFDIPPTPEQKQQVQEYVARAYAEGSLPVYLVNGRWSFRRPSWLKPPPGGWPKPVWVPRP